MSSKSIDLFAEAEKLNKEIEEFLNMKKKFFRTERRKRKRELSKKVKEFNKLVDFELIKF